MFYRIIPQDLSLTWALDGWIIVVAMLGSLACALLGNFLVLRRMSMLGDAVSHAVLPGLAIAFFVTASRSSLPMFVGAVVTGVLTAFFVQWIHRTGNVDEGASLGVVFTTLFATGLVLIVQAADRVDLDASCVLYGAIEMTPLDQVSLFGLTAPRTFFTLGFVVLLNLLFVVFFFKELKITSFDPSLATSAGINASLMHYALMTLVALTAVACFESVGSVLVVAMFVVPPAAAHLLTDRLRTMIWISSIIACLAAVSGHLSAIVVPRWFGLQSTTTASMIAVCAGLILAIAALFAPRHGIVIKFVRRKLLSLQILTDDIVALLFRLSEREAGETASVPRLTELLLSNRSSMALAMKWLRRRGEIETLSGEIALTQTGRVRAQNLVRSHRLWESYLQEQAGIAAAKVHGPAEKLEHFTDSQLRQQLDAETNAPKEDPHGREIPVEGE